MSREVCKRVETEASGLFTSGADAPPVPPWHLFPTRGLRRGLQSLRIGKGAIVMTLES